MGLFDPINKALKGQPVAPAPADPALTTGQGPTRQDIEDQWNKDHPPANDLIDQLHPVGSK